MKDGLLLLEMGCQESHVLNSDNGIEADELKLDGYNQKKNTYENLNKVSTLNNKQGVFGLFLIIQ